MRNKSRLAGLLAIVLMTLSTALAFTSTAAQATNQEQQETCHEDFQEYLYERTIRTETFKTQYEVDKYVRDRTREYVEGTKGQHYSWTGKNLPTNQPPVGDIPPSDNWQANTHQEPHNHATWVNASLHYTHASEQAASWFYFQAGTDEYSTQWSDWSAPYRWVPVGSHLAWVDVVPAPDWKAHGNQTNTYQRQWTVYPTGNTRQVSTGFEESTEQYGWTEEAPPLEGWTLIDERTSQREVECPPVTTVPPTTEPPVTTQPPTTEPPVTTQPPTTEPPVTTVVETTQPPVVETTQPPTVSIGTAPVPPTQPPFTPTATPGDELPETGTNNGLLLLIAAGMLGAGSLLIAATRRKGTIN